ncbi:MAG: SDR family oxidoreductase [Calditrichaeota bacterium]|nr:SDR family oxidoreductase [Calditrichota bacterium]HQU72276.1 SDR family oxidoreductase [Calditrichia bacterium]
MTSGKSDPKVKYALILGSSSGFGGAAAKRLAQEGYHIFGVHLDRRATMPQVEALVAEIKALGVEVTFYNVNASDEEKRKEICADIRSRIPQGGYLKVLMHSLAFGTLKPFVDEDPAQSLTKANIQMTMDVMAHSLIYWTQDLVWNNLLGYGSRIYGMTSHGSTTVVPTYGAVSAAKAALEAHIRQLALELGHLGITANALKAGVTDTAALRKIPGHDRMIELAKNRNPGNRLTTPEDVANAMVSLCSMNSQWINGDVISVDNAENVIDR